VRVGSFHSFRMHIKDHVFRPQARNHDDRLGIEARSAPRALADEE
jgi:hypothetical protein